MKCRALMPSEKLAIIIVPPTTSKAFQAQEGRQTTILADCYSRIEIVISEFRQICWQKQAFFVDVHSLDRFVNT